MSEPRQRCAMCGEYLTDDNSYKQPTRINRYTPYCIKCQPRVYTERAAMVGFKLAMFTCCLEFNMPYLPELMDEAKNLSKGKNPWIGYTTILARNGHHKAEKMSGFVNGVTDIRKAFDGSAPTIYVDDEYVSSEGIERNRKEQNDDWGFGPDDEPYTQNDLDFLDEQFAALTENRTYISQQTELTIKQICEYKLIAQRCMGNGKYNDAKNINMMVKELMESEQLRKKDEIPQDRVRLDDIAIAIERAGIPIMDYEELCKTLANYRSHKKYPYTLDAADQALLLIRNATAWNEGVAEVASLPPSLHLTDDMEEFADKPDDTEEKIYKELGLTRMDGK